MIPVIVGKRFDPALARTVEHREGMTLADIVAIEFADATEEQRQRLEVRLVGRGSEMVIPARNWSRVRPRAGASVIVRARLARGDVLRVVLSIVILVSAAFLGPMVAGALGFGSTGMAATVATSLLTIGGNLALSALLPGPKNKNAKREDRYSLTGSRNGANPWGPVPDVKGRMRIYPPFSTEPYTVSIGDDQKLRMQFLVGYGPLDLTDFKIGETALADLKGVELVTRTVLPGGDVGGIYPEPVFQENINVELKRRKPGETAPGPELNWQKQATASFLTELEVDYTFPRGLCNYDKKGNKRNFSVTIACRWRRKGDTVWNNRPNLIITAASIEPIRRADRWPVPSVGQYEIEAARVTDDNDVSQISDQIVWTAWRGWRPVKSIRCSKAVVVCDLEILASGQLNGVVDQFNCVAQSIRPDFDADAQAWISRPTSNPASLYRDVLQGAATHLPRSDIQIDLPAIEEWAAWCAVKGLEYNRYHNTAESLDEVLAQIARAGRAMPSRHFGVHSVVIDRPQEVIRGLITPRNAHSFSGEVTYRKVEDALRVKFIDRSNGWAQTERIVKRPGFSGDPETFFEMEFPGVTEAEQAYRAALHWFHERLLRFETFWASQDYEALFAPIGSLVMLTYPVLSEQRTEARIIDVEGNTVALDHAVTMETGVSYGLRCRTALNGHFVRHVVNTPGRTDILMLGGAGQVPKIGDLVVFGVAGEEAIEAVVKGVESQRNLSARLTLVRHAPEIEALVDGAVIPAWMPLIPDDRPYATTQPTAPVITAIISGSPALEVGSNTPPVTVFVKAGSGNRPSLASFTVTANGQVATTPAGVGRATFSFPVGAELSITAIATSLTGIDGPACSALAHTVQARDDLPPAVVSFSAIRLGSGARQYTWAIDGATPDDVLEDIAGFRIKGRPGRAWEWEDLGALHTGNLPISPWETSQPLTEGIHTLGIAAVDIAGQEGPPKLIEVDLGPAYGAGITLQRIESDLNWPGDLAGGSVDGEGVLRGITGQTLVYTTPVIDIGPERSVQIFPISYGVVGNATITLQIGLTGDFEPTGDWINPGQVTAHTIRVRISISSTTAQPALAELVTII